MRCLYCNKKLSLLKLAKGDSFCSAEHFDSYQLQLSKDAIDRLMSVPDEDLPKTPLIIPKEKAPDEITVPPLAAYAASRLPAYSLNATLPVANGPESTEPLDAMPAVAFPVHDVDVTVCILNLYLRLSLLGSEPKGWTSPRYLIVTPEYFQLAIQQPAIDFPPDSTEIEQTAAIEKGPPAKKPTPFLTAPSFLERSGTAAFVSAAANSIEMPLGPVLCGPGPVVPGTPPPGKFADAALGPEDSTAQPMGSAVEFPAAADVVAPGAPKPGRVEAWRPSSRTLDIKRTAVEAGGTSTRPVDFVLQRPGTLLVRPDSQDVRKVDPQKALGTDAAPLFKDVLDTPPLGQASIFIDSPAGAMAARWTASLPASSAWIEQTLVWQHRDAYLAMSDTIASGSEARAAELPPMACASECFTMQGAETLRLPPPYVATGRLHSTAWPEVDSGYTNVPAERTLILNGSTILPQAAGIAAGGFRANADSAALRWDARAARLQNHAPAKFLPARNGIVLPATENWPTLRAVPL